MDGFNNGFSRIFGRNWGMQMQAHAITEGAITTDCHCRLSRTAYIWPAAALCCLLAEGQKQAGRNMGCR